MPGAALTDAEMAAALRLTIAEWQRARRAGLIPAPAVKVLGKERWTPAQLAAMLGERPSADPLAAQEAAMRAVDALA